jgi:pimeloyl-ACP methyl ester carboxylesterase
MCIVRRRTGIGKAGTLAPAMNGAIDRLGLPPERWTDVDGPVHYREWPGPASGPVFVLVHGLAGSLLNWALVAPGLAERGRTIALDLAGFGLTPPDGRGTAVGSSWRLLDGFLKALELPPVILVGNSMGGMVSLIQAAHSPRSVDRLILVDAAFPRTNRLAGQFSPGVAALFAVYAANRRLSERFVAARARRLGAEGLVRETLRLVATDPGRIDPALVEALIELARRREGFPHASEAFLNAARSIFRAQVRPGPFRRLVKQVRTPALVTHGARDRLVPVEAAREAACFHPNWRLVVFDDLGHVPQMEAPTRWLDAVISWLDAAPADSEDEAAG